MADDGQFEAMVAARRNARPAVMEFGTAELPARLPELLHAQAKEADPWPAADMTERSSHVTGGGDAA